MTRPGKGPRDKPAGPTPESQVSILQDAQRINVLWVRLPRVRCCTRAAPDRVHVKLREGPELPSRPAAATPAG